MTTQGIGGTMATKGVDVMATINVTFRMDENLKKTAETIFEEMGMNMTTAFTIFTKAVVKQGKIPFEISVDPFYSEANQAHLNKVIDKIESGEARYVVKTIEELEAMESQQPPPTLTAFEVEAWNQKPSPY